MSTVPSTIWNFARRLLALEAAHDASTGAAARVCDRLRVPLVRLAGIAGFRSLLSRALALAKAEDVSLNAVQIRGDASLDGFDGVGHGPGADGAAALVAQLLGLLVTFIGEPLTRQLVSDAWPDAVTDETDRRTEGQP